MASVFRENFLEGKVALITGGRSGILRGIVIELLKYGCSVAMMSRDEKKTLEAAEEYKKLTKNPNVVGFKCDIRNYAEIEGAVDKTIERFKKIDILINGAAGNFLSLFDTLSAKGFKTVIDIDLLGTYNTTKVVYEKAMKGKGGCIVNISATLHYNGAAMQTHAGAAKAGIDAITKHLAVELGPQKIRINGVAPGAIEGTEGFDRLKPKDAKNDALLVALPIHRYGTPTDIAHTVLFLVSDSASYITGQTIVVDGGQVLTIPNFGVMYPDFQKIWKPNL